MPTKTSRLAFFPVFISLAISSIASTKHILWFVPAAAGIWTQAVVLNILHVTSLLCIEQLPLNPRYSPPYTEGGRRGFWNLKAFTSIDFRAAYKLWGNPQLLNATSSNKKMDEGRVYLTFFSFRLIKLLLYYFLYSDLIPRCISYSIGEFDSTDFAPASSHLFPDIYSLTQRQIKLRAYIAFYWIYEGVLILDTVNCALAILFVATGLDRPSDWPPLFGNPVTATSLRSFWSKFWHQIPVRTYTNYGKMLARIFHLPAKSKYAKTLVAFTVFLISGLSHSVVSYHLGHMATWQQDTYWFILNFLICALEPLAFSLLKSGAEMMGLGKTVDRVQGTWVGKIFGYTWVFLIFWWSVPMWKFPALHAQIVQRKENERWMKILQSATIVRRS
jgi:hypothetical protein